MANLKKIKIPSSIRIRLEGNMVDYEFGDFVINLLNTQDYFNMNGLGIRSAVRIETKIKKQLEAANKDQEGNKISDEASFVILDEPDWKVLLEAAENPTRGYDLKPSRVILPFIEAICTAENC
jgi:hypothetical protein